MNEEQVAKLEAFVNEFNQKLSAVEEDVGELRHNFMMLLTSLGFVEDGCEGTCGESCCGEDTEKNSCWDKGNCGKPDSCGNCVCK